MSPAPTLRTSDLDPDRCYRALRARDARFDGVFFVAVTTTGIYCRPICPARPARRDRCAFYRSAAECEKGGFRACFRCRPELAPGSSRVDALSRLVARAVERIEAGALDEGGLDDLARELDVSTRHLRRAVTSELGVSPIELAQTRRLALAKQLLQDTSSSIAEIALASGFGSIRRFNDAFRARFDRPPTEVRRAAASDDASDGLALTLGYRAPFDWRALLAFLGARAISGVEHVEGDTYARTIRLGARAGWIAIAPLAGRDALRVRVMLPLEGGLVPLVARLRRVFDLDAHPDRIAEHLARDPAMKKRVARRPGLRVPGAFDPFETAVRAVLGQQVTVAGATTLAGRLAARFGEEMATPNPALRVLFPRAERLARVSLESLIAIGLTSARARTILELARAVASGALRLDDRADPDRVVAEMQRVFGIGAWTAQYVAMRVLGAPDAFPGADLGLLRALKTSSARDVLARAEAWRPWRAYAAMHLWMGDDE